VRRFAAGLAVLSLAAPARATEDVIHGATVSASFGTSSAGDTLMGQVGGAWAGLRALDRGWLMQWDLLVAMQAGYLGNEHPYLFLSGPHLAGWLEIGRRLQPSRSFSPYVGVRLAGDASYLGNPDVVLSQINVGSGVAGPVAHGAARVAIGSASATDARALLITLYAQEAVDGPGIHTTPRAFTEGGASVRFDVAGVLMTSLDGFCGATFDQHDALRGLTDSTLRCGVAATARKVFKNGMWLGASVSLAHDTDRVVYDAGATYETGDPPVFGVALWYGLSFWRPK